MVRPNDQFMTFVFQLERYLIATVLTPTVFVTATDGFFKTCLRTVLQCTQVHTWWRHMAEDTRAVSVLGLEPASDALLNSTLTEFLKVYLLLRCREFNERVGLHKGANKSDTHLRDTMKGQGTKRSNQMAKMSV